MTGYLGSFEHRIDEKDRLSLPAQFRRESGEQPLVLVHPYTESLHLYPHESWLVVQQRLRDTMRQDPDARPYVLGVLGNAVEVSLDKQGRILVPRRLQEAVGIGGPALVLGLIDHVELWDPERYRARTEASAADAARFTHKIFG